MTRAKNTEKTWPQETPEEVLARLDPATAELVARYIEAEPKRTKIARNADKNWRVGEKPRKRRALPKTKAQGVSWRERGNQLKWPDQYQGPRHRKSGLPFSGAPMPPKKVP